MMTREERDRCGWEEMWGLYDLEAERWYANGAWYVKPKKRDGVTRFTEAKIRAYYDHHHDMMVVPRRFWRRRKPKAPPPLQVGDEVVVRGKVNELDPDSGLNTRIRLNGADCSLWFRGGAVERVKP